jgi:1-deoxy-D-xylulose-5-phosphate reductoisomerase
MVVNALVGFVGLKPSITALENNKILCLANKESLVVGGEIINNLLKQGKGKLYPIDSEHVAIAKCLAVQNTDIDKVIITASGGAFRNLSRDQLKNVTPEQALNHPNWKMGKKITIDSATMVNKAFEIIEAHYLFGLPIDKISTILNLNSYVHSLVRYNNGTYRMEVGKPDMRKPIKYALYQGLINYETVVSDDLTKIKNTTFADFNEERYPIVRLAKKVILEKGSLGAVFNAANEEAVYAFLDHKIPFLGIEEIINQCVNEHKLIKKPNYDTLKKIDLSTRAKVRELINGRRN